MASGDPSFQKPFWQGRYHRHLDLGVVVCQIPQGVTRTGPVAVAVRGDIESQAAQFDSSIR